MLSILMTFSLTILHRAFILKNREKMAKFVTVCHSDDYQFERRQIPLVLDDSLTMVVQFADNCIDCDHLNGIKCKDIEGFVHRFNALSKDEVAIALMVTSKDIINLLTHSVQCVGCRRSVERMFNQLVSSQHPALEPLIINKSAVMSINRNHLFDPRALYSLFYIHGAKLSAVMDAIPKSKKNKRCNLHSLETHKVKTTRHWIGTWHLLSKECRDEVVLIDTDSLQDTLENYLQKHRFCSECKSKVQRAFSILVGDVDSSKEKGYCPALYEGLRCCPQEHHIHLKCDTDFIGQLIRHAEPEIIGSSGRKDRHAKTMDVAQEEVLTCLGIHIYERLHKILQKLKTEEQTWQILFSLGIDALRLNYEMALEKKQGVSNLELMCEELLEEEHIREERQEKKRERRKKKKAKSGQLHEKEDLNIEDEEEDNERCNNYDSSSCNLAKKSMQFCSSSIGCHHDCSAHNSNAMLASMESCHNCDQVSNSHSHDCCTLPSHRSVVLLGSTSSDHGYSSSGDGCESCSIPSSNEGLDNITCSERVCTRHYGEDRILLCNSSACSQCSMSKLSSERATVTAPPQKRDKYEDYVIPSCDINCGNPGQYQLTFSLEDMLEKFCSSEDEVQISEEDILRFKADETILLRKWQELRETLRQRFNSMQNKRQPDKTAK